MLVRAALVLCTMPLVASCETGPELISFSVVSSFPHDPDAYTQGLLFHDGHLYESTGRLGQSTVRRAVAETGAVVAQTALDSLHFGEGLARVNNELYQLTWKAGTALVYDLESLELVVEVGEVVHS